jgi:uncharacterized protein
MEADWFHPVQDVESASFWRGCRDGKLLLKLCDGCGRSHFYPRDRCPFCWSEATRWIEASGRGRLHSYSIIHQNPVPPFKDRCPYAVVLVDLDEGPRILSNWDKDISLDRLACDLPVMIAFRSFDDGLVLPVFRPIG